MKIIHLDSIDSTSKEVFRLLGNGESNILVVSDEQTNGYGTNNRNWHSSLGNLFMSFDVNFDKEPIELLSYITCCSLHKTISKYINSKKLQIKHPNDILYGEKKLSGIIIESYTNNLYIIGIGVNFIISPIEKSICLSEIINDIPTKDEFINNFITFLKENLVSDTKKLKHYYYNFSL